MPRDLSFTGIDGGIPPVLSLVTIRYVKSNVKNCTFFTQVSRDVILKPQDLAKLVGIYKLNRKYKVDLAKLFEMVAKYEEEGHELSTVLELTRKDLVALLRKQFWSRIFGFRLFRGF